MAGPSGLRCWPRLYTLKANVFIFIIINAYCDCFWVLPVELRLHSGRWGPKAKMFLHQAITQAMPHHLGLARHAHLVLPPLPLPSDRGHVKQAAIIGGKQKIVVFHVFELVAPSASELVQPAKWAKLRNFCIAHEEEVGITIATSVALATLQWVLNALLGSISSEKRLTQVHFCEIYR